MLRNIAKLLIASLAIGAGGCSSPNPSETVMPRQLDRFSFRGLVPGVTTMKEAAASGVVEHCDSDSCFFVKSMVGDTPAGVSTVVFKRGAFDWFSFQPAPGDYEPLLTTLTQAYGEPCATSSAPLQNAMGAHLSGDEAQWCFKEGKLTLRRHSATGRDSLRGDLDFFTAHPYDGETVTKFTADTL